MVSSEKDGVLSTGRRNAFGMQKPRAYLRLRTWKADSQLRDRAQTGNYPLCTDCFPLPRALQAIEAKN